MMNQNKAWAALNYFFNLDYDVLQIHPDLRTLFVSDSGILYCHNSQQTERERLHDLISAIHNINTSLMSQNYLTKLSIVFGDF